MVHIPVLLDEIISLLLPDGRRLSRVVDGTLGAGGHARALLEAGAQEVLAFDLDLQAITLAKSYLADYSDRVHFVHDSYASMRKHAQLLGWDAVDAVLLDLGLSSMQLDTPERGFAFMHDALLDMRFDQSDSQMTAADIVNQWDAADLAHIFFQFGEEPNSKKFAQVIVQNRPINSTQELAKLIASAAPRHRQQHIHPATRIFQALRIAVNGELQTVEVGLNAAIDLLRPGGKLAIITFHSLEDRIVKQAFKTASTAITAPPGMASIEERQAVVQMVTRKPVVPSAEEMGRNPRSRSAKLRVVEKL